MKADQMPEHLIDLAEAPKATILFAHGAGAPMDSPFMQHMVSRLVARNLSVVRFEFKYMAQRRIDSKRRPAPKAETLIPEMRAALAELERGLPIVLAGKSMGGRVASMMASEAHAAGDIAGAICMGYPFHPPKKPEQLRTAHLQEMTAPVLILQGERDPFGSRDEVTGYTLSPAIRLNWLPDGDHDFGPRGASGYTRSANLGLAADKIAEFVAELIR